MRLLWLGVAVAVGGPGCDDGGGPFGNEVPAAAPIAPAPAAPAPAPEPVENPPPPVVLQPAQVPARDRRDSPLRRSLDPGDCPAGMSVQGRAPPHGVEQYCASADGTRFGPARIWPEEALPSSGGYIPGQNFRPIAVATYHDGKLHGPSIQWSSSGLRRVMRRYNLGVPAGIWVEWNDEGILTTQRNYFEPEAPPPPALIAQTGRRDPNEAWAFGSAHLLTEYYDDGQMSRQVIRLDDEHELIAGSRTWYRNGQQKCQADQLPGRMAEHVHWVCWYDNGNKREEGDMRGGERHGEWTEWARNGSVRTHGTYFEGKKTGTWERYVGKRKKVQTFAVPIVQTLDPLPKMWIQVFKAGNSVELHPNCDGVSRSITITGDHLIVSDAGESRSFLIESAEHEGDNFTLGLEGKQSIRVLYKGEGTAALWRKPSKKLADVAGIYVPTAMVDKLETRPAEGCGGTEKSKE